MTKDCPLTPELAQTLVGQYLANKGKTTVARAKNILILWLRTCFTRDAWGNYHAPSGERWHFKSTVLNRQVKEAGDWRSVASSPILAAALALVADAAKVVGDTVAAERVKAERVGRVADKKARASAAEEKRANHRAALVAAKRIAWEDRAVILRALGVGKPLPAEPLAELQAKVKLYTREYRLMADAGVDSPPDGDFATVDRPPLLPLARDVSYQWVEHVGPLPYTVRVETSSKGVALIRIGQQGSGLDIDAATRAMTTTRATDLQGDGYLSARVEAAPDGRLGAALFMLVSHKPTAALRLWGLWCRMMRGYGIGRWLGEGLNEAATKMVRAMAKNGSIQIEAEYGSSMVIRCAERKPNPGKVGKHRGPPPEPLPWREARHGDKVGQCPRCGRWHWLRDGVMAAHGHMSRKEVTTPDGQTHVLDTPKLCGGSGRLPQRGTVEDY